MSKETRRSFEPVISQLVFPLSSTKQVVERNDERTSTCTTESYTIVTSRNEDGTIGSSSGRYDTYEQAYEALQKDLLQRTTHEFSEIVKLRRTSVSVQTYHSTSIEEVCLKVENPNHVTIETLVEELQAKGEL